MALPDTLKPVFASEAALTVTGFSTLANAATATSDAVNNSSTLYDEMIIEIKVGGTAAATAWLDVRLLYSIDGGTDYSSWTTSTILPAIDMSVDNPVYHTRCVCPEFWKLSVKNNTGSVLDVGSASFQGINMQVVD
jgi:hypothetical protein